MALGDNLTPKTDPISNEPADTQVVINSSNRKLKSRKPSGTPISTTSRTASTCAPDCPFVSNNQPHDDSQGVPICYANEKLNRPSIFQLVAKSKNSTTVKNAMDTLRIQAAPNSTVRHLVSGDVVSNGSQDYVQAANELHFIRHDLQGWGYTHHWRRMTSDAAKGWVLNASTETPEQAAEAIGKGWQAVIESPADQSLAGTRIAGRRVVTCPNQLHHDIGCADCHLCRSNSPTRPVVEFLIHGTSKDLKNEVSNRVMQARQADAAKASVAPTLGEHFKSGSSSIGEIVQSVREQRAKGIGRGLSA